MRVKKLWSNVVGTRPRPAAGTWPEALKEADSLKEEAQKTRDATMEAASVADEKLDDWLADDAAASVIIIGTIKLSQYQQEKDTRSAQGRWEALKRTHEAPGRHRLAHLLQQFYRFSIDSRSIDEAAAQLDSLQSKIKMLRPDNAPDDYDMAVILLCTVGPEFQVVRIILSGDVNLTYSATVAHLKEEEDAQRHDKALQP